MPLPLEDDLSAELIRQAMTSAAQALLRELTVLEETDSTNACLARLPLARAPCACSIKAKEARSLTFRLLQKAQIITENQE